LVKFSVILVESDPSCNVGLSELFGELGFVSAPRETDPSPVVTRGAAEVQMVQQRYRNLGFCFLAYTTCTYNRSEVTV